MSVLQSEAIAYLAQCLYVRQRTGNTLEGSPALKVASVVAKDVAKGKKHLSDNTMLTLVDALFRTRLYKNDRYRMSGYNGIP